MSKKKILVTAGCVYGNLDSNKLVSNRAQGIWAAKFAQWLHYQGHHVALVVADIEGHGCVMAVDENGEMIGA
jgi:hypothetical protein